MLSSAHACTCRTPCRGVSSLAVSSSKKGALFVAGHTGQVVELGMQTGAVKNTFQASKHAVTCVALSPGMGQASVAGMQYSFYGCLP